MEHGAMSQVKWVGSEAGRGATCVLIWSLPKECVPADTDLSAEGPVLGFCLWNSDSNSDSCLDFLNPYLFQNPVQGNTWLPKPFLAFAGLESHTDDWLCVLEYGSTGICVVFFSYVD